MHKVLEVILYILVALTALFGLVVMFGISVPGGVAFLIAAVLFLPAVVRRVGELTSKAWVSPVVAVLVALLVAPIVTSVTAPTPEEVAALDAQRAVAAEEKRKIAEARAEKDRVEAKQRAGQKAIDDAKKAEEKRKKDCSDTVMAFIKSQDFVKRALKSPSTAKFPYAHDNDVAIQKIGECKFRVLGYVDAQNGFGAFIRERYTIEMEYFPDTKTWGGKNLKM